MLPASQSSAVAGFHRAFRHLRRAALAARGAFAGEAARREAPAAAAAQAVHRSIAPQLRVCCTRSCSAIREFALFPITFDSLDSRQMTDTAAAHHAACRFAVARSARTAGAHASIGRRCARTCAWRYVDDCVCKLTFRAKDRTAHRVPCRVECRVSRPAHTPLAQCRRRCRSPGNVAMRWRLCAECDVN